MKRISSRRFWRELTSWSLALTVSFTTLWYAMPEIRETEGAVTNNGVIFYGDTTTAGTLRARVFTNPSTWAAEISGASAFPSNILWTIAETALTREEMMIGTLSVSGGLGIQTCTAGCDAGSDFTLQWTNPGTTATQDCDSAPTAGTCERAFDVGYEALSGRAFVAYADNVADVFYYARWDGSAWSPNSTPGTPGASNEVNLPGSAGTPEWIRVIPAGDNLADDRSNRVMVLVGTAPVGPGDRAINGFYWDGSTFDAGTTLEGAPEGCDTGQCFDGNWQGNSTFVVSYFDADATNDVKYRTYTVGTGWGSETQAYTTASAGRWIVSVADPTSSRILVTTSTSGNDTRNAVWRGDDTTDGWTVCAVTDCPDTTTETVSGMQAYTAFERFNGEGLHLYHDTGTTATGHYFTYTPASTWGAKTRTGITTSDDAEKVKAWGSPNNDDIMFISEDVDCDTYAQLWNGSGLEIAVADLEALNSEYGVACPGLTAPGTAPAGAAFNYDFAWNIYSPWQRNWRFYSGSDTANTPTTALAAENTAPTGFGASGEAFRIRINYAERANSGINSLNERKKLQYTSGCDPNASLESSCTWTDVDDPAGAGIWRYKTGICASCTDGTLLAGVALTGTNATCSVGNGCGTWVMDKDATPGTNMDHNANIIQESEWDVESNGAASSTTYYFRIYNVLIGTDGQETPIYREQDADDCGAGSAQCSYPSLTTATPGPTTDDLLRHGNWFSSGVEQSFFWAD